MSLTSESLTTMLSRIEAGDEAAREELLVASYDELRSLAGDLMRQERANHTLQPTALVHEALLRVRNQIDIGQGRGRAYFFAVMAGAMRRVLVDHARARRSARRGGKQQRRVPLDEVLDALEQSQRINLLDLEQALRRLASWNARQAEVVTLRYFGGWTVQAIAEHLEVSASTVEKDWRLARAWLGQQLKGGRHDTGTLGTD